MTSSNMLSIINITKSNLDIKSGERGDTPDVCHCLCVFLLLYVIFCVFTKHSWLVSVSEEVIS